MQQTNPALSAKRAHQMFTVNTFCLVVEEIQCQLLYMSLFRHDSYSLPTLGPEGSLTALHTGSSSLHLSKKLTAFHSFNLCIWMNGIIKDDHLSELPLRCVLYFSNQHKASCESSWLIQSVRELFLKWFDCDGKKCFTSTQQSDQPLGKSGKEKLQKGRTAVCFNWELHLEFYSYWFVFWIHVKFHQSIYTNTVAMEQWRADVSRVISSM